MIGSSSIKTAILVSVSLSALVGSSNAYQAGDLVWSDEFDGAVLNANGDWWTHDLGGGGWGNDELQIYTQESVTVNGGSLQITASQQAASPVSSGAYHSGRIHTQDKFEYKYGILEASIKIPPTGLNNGLWPALWTMGQDFGTVPWPGAGEFDIFEMGQGLAASQGLVNHRVISAAHWEHEGTYVSHPEQLDTVLPLNDGNFHTVTFEWTPSYLRTYLGTIASGTMIFEMYIGLDVCTDCQEFHDRHFLLVNMAVGGRFTYTGSNGGTPCETSNGAGCSASNSIDATLPATLEVDYLRLYATEDTDTSLPVPPTIAPTAAPSGTQFSIEQVSSPTREPTAEPTSAPAVTELGPTVGPTSAPAVIELGPTAAPQPEPQVEPQVGPADEDDDTACIQSASSGKAGKGKGDSRRAVRTLRKLCNSSGKGKGGKGKGGSKSGSGDGSGSSIRNADQSSQFAALSNPSSATQLVSMSQNSSLGLMLAIVASPILLF